MTIRIKLEADTAPVIECDTAEEALSIISTLRLLPTVKGTLFEAQPPRRKRPNLSTRQVTDERRLMLLDYIGEKAGEHGVHRKEILEAYAGTLSARIIDRDLSAMLDAGKLDRGPLAGFYRPATNHVDVS